MNNQRLCSLPNARGVVTRLPDKSGYLSPVGKLDSVTSILGKTSETKHKLEQWKKRPDAAAVSDAAKARGTWTHEQIENWIVAHTMGTPAPDPKHFAFGAYWRNIKPFLEQHWVQLVAQECAVYHPTRFAGSFDALGYSSYTKQPDLSTEDASNLLTLIDWKTSKNPRSADLVEDYFNQLGAYAVGIEYVYGVVPERALLVIARPHGDFPDIWELTGPELKEYGTKFIYRANNYYTTQCDFEP